MSRTRKWLSALAVAAAAHLVAGAGLWAVLWLAASPPIAATPTPPTLPPGAVPYDIDLQNTANPATATASPAASPKSQRSSAGPVPRPAPPDTNPEITTPTVASPVAVVPSDSASAAAPTTAGGAQPRTGPPGAPQPPALHGNGSGSSTPGPVGVVGVGVDRNQLIARALARIRSERHYPELARRRGIEGTVHIAFFVGADGQPRQITVLRGADPLLDEAAREAVQRAAPLPPLGAAELDLDFRLDGG